MGDDAANEITVLASFHAMVPCPDADKLKASISFILARERLKAAIKAVKECPADSTYYLIHMERQLADLERLVSGQEKP
jgi:hypothetical protein